MNDVSSIISSLVNVILALAANQQMLAPSSTYLNTPQDTGKDERIVPIPLATEPANITPIPLYKPDPTCLEWDLRKKSLESFLSATEDPIQQMEAFMRAQERSYKEKTGQSLLANESAWSDDYKNVFNGLNNLIDEKNRITKELRTMKDTETQAAIISGMSEGAIALSYCQKGNEI